MKNDLLQLVLVRLREHGITPRVEPGHGSHLKVRWDMHMLIVPRYAGGRRQRYNLMAQLNRKLRGPGEDTP